MPGGAEGIGEEYSGGAGGGDPPDSGDPQNEQNAVPGAAGAPQEVQNIEDMGPSQKRSPRYHPGPATAQA
jgi:hypothetical protein